VAIGTVILGGGKMGAALLAGVLGSGADPAAYAVVETSSERRSVLGADRRLRGVTVAASTADLELAEGFGVVLAVKPADVAAAAASVEGAGRVLCIAAGVTLATLGELLPGPALIRAMPNTAALVGAAASGLSAAAGAGPEDVAWAEALLSAVGTVVRVPEPLLDAVTGLSGSGPAYLFLVAEAMTDAGVLVGLTRDVAAALTAQTILGAGRLLSETGDGPVALRAAVTSPGGTTAAGLLALEHGSLRAVVADAVVASAARASQLGGT
jgi:pyrroline-5-carboxylate reductase